MIYLPTDMIEYLSVGLIEIGFDIFTDWPFEFSEPREVFGIEKETYNNYYNENEENEDEK